MSSGVRSRVSAFLLLGLMALLVTPRDLLHQCDLHDHGSPEAVQTVHADEDCAICQAVIGHVLPAPAPVFGVFMGVEVLQASEPARPAVVRDSGVRVPRGPPAQA